MNISRPRWRRVLLFQLISSFGDEDLPVMPCSDRFFVLAPDSEYPLTSGLKIVPVAKGLYFLPTFTTSNLVRIKVTCGERRRKLRSR